MRSALPDIAAQLGADARTLRRAATRGALRCQRPSPRSLKLAPGELAYLEGHWGTLSELTRAFRTEPTVELAILYGSVARGSERPGSDVDILVGFRPNVDPSTGALARRLEERVRARVDIASLSRVRRQSPLLLLQALDEGRVLVDRSESWPALHASRETVARASRRKMARDRQQAAAGLAELLAQ